MPDDPITFRLPLDVPGSPLWYAAVSSWGIAAFVDNPTGPNPVTQVNFIDFNPPGANFLYIGRSDGYLPQSVARSSAPEFQPQCSTGGIAYIQSPITAANLCDLIGIPTADDTFLEIFHATNGDPINRIASHPFRTNVLIRSEINP